jgi:ABC-type phosphate transport system permease subunit
MIATMIGLACLAAILWTLISLDSPACLCSPRPTARQRGGLLNAIYGSAVMTLLGI